MKHNSETTGAPCPKCGGCECRTADLLEAIERRLDAFDSLEAAMRQVMALETRIRLSRQMPDEDRHPLPSELPPEAYEEWKRGVFDDAARQMEILTARQKAEVVPDPSTVDQSASGPSRSDVSGYMWAYLRGD